LVAWVAFPKWRWTKVAQKSQNLRLLLLQWGDLKFLVKHQFLHRELSNSWILLKIERWRWRPTSDLTWKTKSLRCRKLQYLEPWVSAVVEETKVKWQVKRALAALEPETILWYMHVLCIVYIFYIASYTIYDQRKFSWETSELRGTVIFNHSHHHVNHIIMSTIRHQVVAAWNSSDACEFTVENALGGETLWFCSGNVAPRVAEVGSLLPRVRAKVVDKKCAGLRRELDLHFKMLKTDSCGALLENEVGRICTRL
jgi:hypothetical protein